MLLSHAPGGAPSSMLPDAPWQESTFTDLKNDWKRFGRHPPAHCSTRHSRHVVDDWEKGAAYLELQRIIHSMNKVFELSSTHICTRPHRHRHRHQYSKSSSTAGFFSLPTDSCLRYISATCLLLVASSGFLSSRTRMNRGNRRLTPL